MPGGGYKRTGMGAAVALLFAAGALVPPGASMQTERTLVGEWRTTWAPINNELFSRKGNTIGFPDRDMFFEQQGELRTGFVNREDAGPDVKPLGVWRINGNRLSATFQLWCPDTTQPCGSIVMRGEFLNGDRVRGTATVFFDEPDDKRPTGYDTLAMTFRGERLSSAIAIPESPAQPAAKEFEGRWTLRVTMPESAASATTKTFTIDVDAGSRGGKPHGRTTITDEQSRTVGGVWRQAGKFVSLAYELPCAGEGNNTCASLILLGRMKNKKRFKSGNVVVMWDTPNDRDPALFDTSKGSFSGERLQ